MQHINLYLFWNWFCNRTCLQSSRERVKLKPACSTALNVKWKHRLGSITVYILWIGITCLMKPARSEGCWRGRARETEREKRLGKWRWEEEWEYRKKTGRREGKQLGMTGVAKEKLASFSYAMAFLLDTWLLSKTARKCNTASVMSRLIPLI